MHLPDFKLERYFAPREHASRFMLSGSDMESLSIRELLALEEGSAERLLGVPLSYTQSSGSLTLRAEIASLYESVDPDDILVFAGAQEAILAFGMTALQAGDHAICVWPSYQSLHEVARSNGVDVSLLELREESGWKLTADEIERQLRTKTKAVFINFPHNPTGATIAPETFREIAGLCRDRGIQLFSDEVYRFSEYEPSIRLPGAADLGGVSLGVMSKAFGLPGLRIGWIATKDGVLLEKLAAFKDYTTICNSAPSEFLAELALRQRDKIIQRNLQLTRSNLAILEPFIEEFGSWVKPEAGCIAFPTLRDTGPIEPFCDRLLAETKVLLLPGTMYDYPTDHFRIGFGRQDFADGLTLLRKYISG